MILLPSAVIRYFYASFMNNYTISDNGSKREIVPNKFSLFGTKIVPNKLNSLGTKYLFSINIAIYCACCTHILTALTFSDAGSPENSAGRSG